jgi:hypothetical protein
MQELAPIAFLDDAGDVRVNFGVFAGRDATQAEIDDLARILLERIPTVTIVAEQRTVADRDGEASIHQIVVELDGAAAEEPLRLVEQWAEACVADRHAEITEV